MHPFPILVPMPTSKPPKTINGNELVTENKISLLVTNVYEKGPSTNPNKNNKFDDLFFVFVRALLAIPLTPASLPVLIKNIITAIPISKPPTKAGKGVKLMVSIVIILEMVKMMMMIFRMSPQFSSKQRRRLAYKVQVPTLLVPPRKSF